MTRSLLAMSLIVSCAASAAAQPPDTPPAGQSMPSLQELRNFVRPGDTLYVIDSQGDETKGRLMNILDRAIALEVDHTRRTLPADSIVRIDRTRRDSVKNGVLIGLATGAVAGYAAGRRVDSPACPRNGLECGQGATIGAYSGAFWGAIGGWIADGLHRTRETIFER